VGVPEDEVDFGGQVPLAFDNDLIAERPVPDQRERSAGLRQAVLAAMQADPRYWSAYYTDSAALRLDLQYSLSDRIRYYWNVPEVRAACDALVLDLRQRGMPLTLISQYLPRQYAAIRGGQIANDPHELLLAGVRSVLHGYASACGSVDRGT
jgi:D-tagatose-1,6-bisphosphate aldolase subunit GatZ/KbaZ